MKISKRLAACGVAGILGLSLAVAYGGGSPPGHPAAVLDARTVTAASAPEVPLGLDLPPELVKLLGDSSLWGWIRSQLLQDLAQGILLQGGPAPPVTATPLEFTAWCETFAPGGTSSITSLSIYYPEYTAVCQYFPVADGGLGKPLPKGIALPGPNGGFNISDPRFPPGATLPPGPMPSGSPPPGLKLNLPSPPTGLKLNLPPGIGNVGNGAKGVAPAPSASGAAGNVGNGAQGVAPAPTGGAGIPAPALSVWTEIPNTELSVISSGFAVIISDLIPASQFTQQISELQQLETIPFSGGLSEDTPAQQAEAQADLAALNAFFGTTGIAPMAAGPTSAPTTAAPTTAPSTPAAPVPATSAPAGAPTTSPPIQNPIIIQTPPAAAPTAPAPVQNPIIIQTPAPAAT